MTDATTFDAIVVGAGTMGTAAAWAFAKRGLRTLVIEQFTHVHTMGAHGGDTRIFRHAYAESPDYVPLVRRADELFQELNRETGIEVLVRTGGLELSAPGHTHVELARESADEHGIPYEWLTPAEVRDRWPMVRVPDDWRALFSPVGGVVKTDNTLRALMQVARANGAVLHENEKVTSWGADATSAWVTTDKWTYHSAKLVIASGGWAPIVLQDLGLPIHILRKTLWWLEVENPGLFTPDRFPCFIADQPLGEIYGFPVFDANGLKVADHSGGNPTTADTADRTARDEEAAHIVEAAQLLFPGVTGKILRSVVCLYAMTPDHHFIVDRHPAYPHVAIGAGFSGHGFKFTPAVGEALVQLACDDHAAPLPILRIDRFAAAED